MTQTGYPGVVRSDVVVLDKETPLTEDSEVLVTPVAGVPDSPAAILAAMDNSPKVPAEWVDELERLIAEGQRPPAPPVLFPNEPGSRENG